MLFYRSKKNKVELLSDTEKNELRRLVLSAQRRKQWIEDCGDSQAATLFQTYIDRLEGLWECDRHTALQGITEARTRLAEGLDGIFAQESSDLSLMFSVLTRN